MTLDEFKESLKRESQPPGDLSPALQALWYDAKGDWKKAHETAQDDEEVDGAWVHAYLHRKEGDLGNARYWYRRSGKPEFKGDLTGEWEQIVKSLLA